MLNFEHKILYPSIFRIDDRCLWVNHFGKLSNDARLTFRRLDIKVPIFELFKKLRSAYRDVFLLESIEGPREMVEYSIIGFEPDVYVELRNGRMIISSDSSIEYVESDPISVLRKLIGKSIWTSYTPRFIGGLVGYISYEACRLWEDFLKKDKISDGFPMIKLGLFSDAIIYDHVNGCYYYCSALRDRMDDLIDTLKSIESSTEHVDLDVKNFVEEPSKEEFIESIKVAKEYIKMGEVFQVVLSRRVRFDCKGDLMLFYEQLRKINPSPYMFYIKLGEDEVVGSSPEMLVRLQGTNLMTCPIAGTRPREVDDVKDAETDLQLLNDEKERAEHVMLVDLARNDLGKVSEAGSVKVTDFMRIVKYSHVKHIVSKVEAKLRNGLDMFDAFKATFPAGTVTGAPKPRALEIIDELEKFERGPYAGAIGYFSFNGCCDFAITIRTLVRRGSMAYIQAGAGIVWDSIPEREYIETEHKMAALLSALRRSVSYEGLDT